MFLEFSGLEFGDHLARERRPVPKGLKKRFMFREAFFEVHNPFVSTLDAPSEVPRLGFKPIEAVCESIQFQVGGPVVTPPFDGFTVRPHLVEVSFVLESSPTHRRIVG
ncbi:hypothetical protein [Natronorarus salvus]|uniref:hypothetical protein n=1 Tax=Natronorarus salvus TaxID=3117733 RepID=UPI002F26D962